MSSHPEFGYQKKVRFTVLIIWVSARGPQVRAMSLMVGAMHLSQLSRAARGPLVRATSKMVAAMQLNEVQKTLESMGSLAGSDSHNVDTVPEVPM
jgi:hypothetical protein